MNNKGFTMIELLAVIVIMAIVAAIAVPAVNRISKAKKEESFISDLNKLKSIAKAERTKNPKFSNKELLFKQKCEITDINCIDFYDIETSPNGKKYTEGKVTADGSYLCLRDGKWKASCTNNTCEVVGDSEC